MFRLTADKDGKRRGRYHELDELAYAKRLAARTQQQADAAAAIDHSSSNAVSVGVDEPVKRRQKWRNNHGEANSRTARPRTHVSRLLRVLCPTSVKISWNRTPCFVHARPFPFPLLPALPFHPTSSRSNSLYSFLAPFILPFAFFFVLYTKLFFPCSSLFSPYPSIAITPSLRLPLPIPYLLCPPFFSRVHSYPICPLLLSCPLLPFSILPFSVPGKWRGWIQE